MSDLDKRHHSRDDGFSFDNLSRTRFANRKEARQKDLACKRRVLTDLTDFDWFWLIFTDFGWFWLILFDLFLILVDFEWFLVILTDFYWFLMIFCDCKIVSGELADN